jgi:hypothetical protein
MPIERSSASPNALQLLLNEIKAIPKEYWLELLELVRQFRQRITPATPIIINLEQAQKNQAAIDLLNSWLDDTEDASEHQQSWAILKTALDEDRLSDRPLFP